MYYLAGFITFLCLHLTTTAAPQKDCKVVPGDLGWPSRKSWTSLNSSIHGRLIRSVPTYAVCHPDRAEYDKKACKAIQGKYKDSLFIAQQPTATDYNDKGCLENPKYPCNDDFYPVYVVNATQPKHVKHAVDFAREHKVRLVVKATGHDWNHRSHGRYSLSIWTRHLKEFQVHDSFKPTSCSDCEAYPAVTLGAGYQVRDVISELGKLGRVAVVGADPNVGVGGFLSAGGHSPISRVYGLGADQILEMEVVTAAGDILKINEKEHPDLFWAVRGGGPSHAVMTSVTVKTYPTSKVVETIWQVNSSTPTSFWDVNTYFHTQIPSISDAGLMGYYYAQNLVQQGGQISGIWLSLDKTKAEMDQIFSNFSTYANKALNTKFFSTSMELKDIAEFYAQNEAESVGDFGRVGSRLVGAEALTRNKTLLKNSLMKAIPPQQLLIGHVVAGKGVADADISGGSDAVTPAWRRAYSHMLVYASWKPFDPKLKHASWDKLTNVHVKALADLDPQAGSYVNEGNSHEPEWQKTFWGSHYPRLFQIKSKWDPQGVFYCFPCVGAEEWTNIGGKLCRA